MSWRDTVGRSSLVATALVCWSLSGCDSPPPVEAPSVTVEEVASAETASSGVSETSTGEPPSAGTSQPEPTPVAARPAKPTGTKDVTFDTIKFEMEKGDPFERTMLTPEIEALVGRPIRIRGYILPSFQQSGLTQFVLVRDNMECCFGPGAALYDCIIVEMKPGKSTNFSVRPVTVEGTFSVRELFDPDGKHLAIYHMAGERVN